ncbi:hypothetical protein MUK42_07855 [Musa troglodytarum]|nr:hypothetical protein MUK42_07855 [Musa troglodytarum]
MIRSVGSVEGAESRAELEPKLASLLSRNLFLVLDDVWSPKVWEDLLNNPLMLGATSNCRIVVTTRNENVARNMGDNIHHVEKMDEECGWELLWKTVWDNRETIFPDSKKLEVKWFKNVMDFLSQSRFLRGF